MRRLSFNLPPPCLPPYNEFQPELYLIIDESTPISWQYQAITMYSQKWYQEVPNNTLYRLPFRPTMSLQVKMIMHINCSEDCCWKWFWYLTAISKKLGLTCIILLSKIVWLNFTIPYWRSTGRVEIISAMIDTPCFLLQ